MKGSARESFTAPLLLLMKSSSTLTFDSEPVKYFTLELRLSFTIAITSCASPTGSTSEELSSFEELSATDELSATEELSSTDELSSIKDESSGSTFVSLTPSITSIATTVAFLPLIVIPVHVLSLSKSD